MWITLNDSSVSAVQFTAEKSEFLVACNDGPKVFL